LFRGLKITSSCAPVGEVCSPFLTGSQNNVCQIVDKTNVDQEGVGIRI